MPLTIGTTSGNKDPYQITIGTTSGNKDIIEGWVGTTSGNKLFFSGATITLDTSYSMYGTDGGFGSASASFALESDGDIIASEGFGNVDVGDWISPKASAPGSYEVRATIVSGSLSSGTTGSWLALTSTRTWVVSRSSPGYSSCVLTIEIRLSGTVLDTTTVTLEAEV